MSRSNLFVVEDRLLEGGRVIPVLSPSCRGFPSLYPLEVRYKLDRIAVALLGVLGQESHHHGVQTLGHCRVHLPGAVAAVR